MGGKPKQILDELAIRARVEKLAAEIAAGGDTGNMAIVGIKTRGVPLADRVVKLLTERHGLEVDTGALDITLYRDDLSLVAEQPVVRGTEIDFDVSDKRIILVDDVLYTGRTIRAAITQLYDFGRPAKIELAVMVDRGHRELPIAADYIGETITTRKGQVVDVFFSETDGRDTVEVAGE